MHFDPFLQLKKERSQLIDLEMLKKAEAIATYSNFLIFRTSDFHKLGKKFLVDRSKIKIIDGLEIFVCPNHSIVTIPTSKVFLATHRSNLTEYNSQRSGLSMPSSSRYKNCCWYAIGINEKVFAS